MGYLGSGSFDNDAAADWLRSLTSRKALRQIEEVLRTAIDFSPDQIAPWSNEKIEGFILRGLAPYKNGILRPPGGRSLADFLAEKERTEREYFSTGRYLDEQYGPAEAAIGAAELVAVWGGQPGADLPGNAISLVNTLKTKPAPSSLVQLARESMTKVLSNGRYQRMRRFYLNAFPDMSGGDDNMGAVKDLLARLKRVERVPSKSAR